MVLSIFGDSISAAGSGNYSTEVGVSLGVTPVITSIGGGCIADLCNEVFATSPASGDVTVINLGTNDKSYNTGDNINRDRVAQTGHLALLLHAGIPDAKKVMGAAMTTSGTWANLSAGVATDGAYSSEYGAVKSATVTGRHIVVSGLWNSTQAGIFSVTIDGANVGTFNATPPGSVPASSNQVWGPFALLFTGYTNGPHLVEIRVTSATGGANCVYLHYVAALTGEDLPGPMVIAANLYNFTPAANAARSITAGRLARMNRYLEQNVALCVALGIDARIADMAPEFGQAELGVDGLHPSSAGHLVIRDAVLDAYANPWPDFRHDQLIRALATTYAGHVYS